MLDVQPVDDTNRSLFYKLSQDYELEFSPITKKKPNQNGIFEFTDQIPGHYDAWLAYNKGNLIGFAVIDISKARHDVAEFYIVPKARQCHFGEQLALHLFEKYTGDWQVRQLIGAEYARDFWISIIKKYTSNSFLDGVEEDAVWGRVYSQKFTSKK